ncbi:hypothetical protein Tco_0908677 [Tanacetum coccineum]|uniref:Reverse transcriptase domain-containing protein n=1 Tax=Tanacetum coccineum TaxID=301880 RepID=A0ABQ5CPX9_9ASTR
MVLKTIILILISEGAVPTWLEKEPPNSITTWNDLQIDTFYNGLNQSNQESLNSAVGGNFLTRNTQEALTIIENKSKVRTSRNKPQASSASDSSSQNDAITTLYRQVDALSKQISSINKLVHVVQEGCETCGGPHAHYKCQAVDGYTLDVYAITGNYNSGGNSYKP